MDFKMKHAVDIGSLAEAPLCPADHSETSLSDFISSSERVQLRTEVLYRVVDAETFPVEAPSCGPWNQRLSNYQNKSCKSYAYSFNCLKRKGTNLNHSNIDIGGQEPRRLSLSSDAKT